MDFGAYIASLPSDHLEALDKLCTDFFDMHTNNRREYSSSWTYSKTHEYQVFFNIAAKFVSNFNLDFDVPSPLSGNENVQNFFKNFHIAVSGWRAEQIFDLKYSPHADGLVLSKEETLELQEKTNQLRKLVQNASYLGAKHKRRLLGRLEKFQSEFHKSISNLDVFLAGWADINNMVEDTGNKSKPIVDRFREIVSSISSKRPELIENDEEPKQIEDQRTSESGE